MNREESICPVPQDQRPINEYLTLKNTFGFSWTTQSKLDYYKDSIKIYFTIFTLLIFSLKNEGNSWKNVLENSVFCDSFILFLFYTRIYLGWSYIYTRLMQATVAYEESGWYDGQIWVKTPETLIQDKLTGQYEVKPILSKLKQTLSVFLFLITISLYCLFYLE